MSLYLTKSTKLNLLKQQLYIETPDKLIELLKISYKKTLNYVEKLIKYEKIIDINYDNCINPILWQLGHIIFFYYNNTLKLLENKNNFKFKLLQIYIKNFHKFYNSYKLYDSDISNRPFRFKYKKNNYKQLKIIYYSIIKFLISYITTNKIDNSDNYIIYLSILHNDMHNENFIFTMYNLHINTLLLFPYNININSNNINDNINTYIKIKGGFFNQGNIINKNNFTFDNELPHFNTYVKQFYVSKYPITEWEYLEFVENNGYIEDKYWSLDSLEWKTNNNIICPIYWYKNNNIWYKLHWNTTVKVGSNLPIVNISWYEAQAYCKWRKCRLITETEWEYLATNKGETLYPWGNDKPNINNCNLNNNNNYCVDVDLYELGNNKDNISQLIGNIWEWCLEPIYPYNNFSIDPIYREMSYPYFGKKKICRGGCFCVSDYLINSKYRNAQYSDCRIQFIGFRVCKLY